MCASPRSLARGSSGFTLLEVLVAIAVAVSLLALILPGGVYAMRGFQRTQTEVALQDLKHAFEAAYRQNAQVVDSAPGAAFTLPGGTIATGAVTPAEMALLLAYGASNPALAARDAFEMPWRLSVSHRLTLTWNGAALSYHKIGIVSLGADGKLDAATQFDPATGQLTLGGDDQGLVVDGAAIEMALADLTQQRLQKLAELYGTYFTSRYLANGTRSVTTNYFANNGGDPALWDGGGAIGNSGRQPLAANDATLNFATVFRLTDEDMKDAWGNPLLVDNSSDETRNPDATDASMRTPPFTAWVMSRQANGTTMHVGVTGTY